MTGHQEKPGNLTILETLALRGGLNVSDGHPRMPLTEPQRRIVEQLAELFDEADKLPFEEIEREAQTVFLHGIGQQSAPVGTGRLLSCYSSSVAMDIVARTLAERGGRVALVHPTFDNIPDLLKARGIELVPVAEEEFERGMPQLPDDVRAVFITTPNNPTGWVLPEQALAVIAKHCAETGRVLVLDTCFRAQDPRAQYDTYRVLQETGVQWAVIEDTGKLWPVLELKAGFLAWSEGIELDLVEAFSDVLLSVSPVILRLISRLAEDAVDGGYADLRALVQRNRGLLAGTLEGTGLALSDADARISVARVVLPEGMVDAQAFYEAMLEHNVHVLPCSPFHWARRDEGLRHFRVALARSEEEVSQAGHAIAHVALGLARERV